tara:strand:- start:1252 stop:1383 length:132 start_codon:yes stop_codon:yes gene_type:complete
MGSWIEEAEEAVGTAHVPNLEDFEYDPYVTAQESEKAPVKTGE